MCFISYYQKFIINVLFNKQFEQHLVEARMCFSHFLIPFAENQKKNSKALNRALYFISIL